METLVQYALPVKGRRDGIHHFDFQIDQSFFKHFENSPIRDCAIDLKLELDKRPGMLVLQFDFSGTVQSECDRCLEHIHLPVSGSQRLLVKMSSEPGLEEADVVYMDPEESSLQVAQYIYEFIVLALPMIRVYECEDDADAPCNPEVLAYLRQEEAEKEEEQPDNNPLMEELKKLNLHKK
jgi:uncharacterized metal-binding protein YceD (DUF177 family)